MIGDNVFCKTYENNGEREPEEAETGPLRRIENIVGDQIN